MAAVGTAGGGVPPQSWPQGAGPCGEPHTNDDGSTTMRVETGHGGDNPGSIRHGAQRHLGDAGRGRDTIAFNQNARRINGLRELLPGLYPRLR
jgi:hypothetical protein